MQKKQEVKATGFHTIDSKTQYVVTTDVGFRIYNINGNSQVKECDKIPGGLSLCQPYKNTQIFFVVGTGGHVDWQTNKLVIWDDTLGKAVAHLEFFKKIIDLKLVRDWIVVVLEDKVVPMNVARDMREQSSTMALDVAVKKRGLVDLFVDEAGVAKIVVPAKQGCALVT